MAEKKKTKETENIREAANKIWMAGIGALRAAEKEGSKIFKSLYEQGQSFQESSKDMSKKQIDRMGEILKGGVGSVKGKIEDITATREGLWDKLGMEDVVTSVLKTAGVATKKEIDTLNRKIDALAKAVNAASVPTKKAAPKAAKPRAAKKPAPAKKNTPPGKS